MFRDIRFPILVLMYVLLSCAFPLHGQQKPQWMPGQVGLNAGIQPSPGFSLRQHYRRLSFRRFNGPSGSAIPVTGSYDVWAVENFFLLRTEPGNFYTET